MSDELRDVHRGGVAQGEPRSLLARPAVWLVRIYQYTVSPMFGQVCRYYPSCSAYSVTALERHGLLRGSWLTLRRLARCHPWASGGVDHVPPRTPHTSAGAHSDGNHPGEPDSPLKLRTEWVSSTHS